MDPSPSATPLRPVWIHSPRLDLGFYLGSSLVGWLYAGLVLFCIATSANPLEDPLFTLRLGGVKIPFTLHLLVVASWALLLDAPHIWATLGRTLFDRDEWRQRGPVLRRSFLWFAVGPLAILSPYVIGIFAARFGTPLAETQLGLGALAFFVFFRLWAYHHVIRQHWGFFSLYKRKADDYKHHRLDTWFFNLSFYLPLVLFISGPVYNQTPGFPNLGLSAPLWNGISLADLLYPLAWAAYLGNIATYCAVQIWQWRQGRGLNISKLLYMAPLVPLHLLAFSHPVMAIFAVPLVTAGHNLQYHCIVYTYAQRKYKDPASQYPLPRFLFKNLATYAAIGLVFTFALYRGPWIDWLKNQTGLQLDQSLFNSIGMMAGLADPASLGLGHQVCTAMLLGFAMQHYYLDGKIWRVNRDAQVQRHLRV